MRTIKRKGKRELTEKQLVAEIKKRECVETLGELPTTWMTSDRVRMAISSMEDGHIINAMGVLERRAMEVKLTVNVPDWNGPQLASEIWPVYRALKFELERRLAERVKTKRPPPEIGRTRRKLRLED